MHLGANIDGIVEALAQLTGDCASDSQCLTGEVRSCVFIVLAFTGTHLFYTQHTGELAVGGSGSDVFSKQQGSCHLIARQFRGIR